jgi:undecaprenyl diphosphate synthase
MPNGQIPKHIAVIMDGNGRWAQNRRLPRVAGHKEGMETVKKVTKKASRLGVKVLTLYAFSTENWKRPQDEVSFLMQLPVDFFDTFVPELIEENVKVNVMGYQELLARTYTRCRQTSNRTDQRQYRYGPELCTELRQPSRNRYSCSRNR